MEVTRERENQLFKNKQIEINRYCILYMTNKECSFEINNQ